MPGDIVIKAEGLGKKYIIGHENVQESYTTLRDVVARTARDAWQRAVNAARGRALIRGATTEEFWALRGVSFEVKQGEVLGIIGHNGAGKSTLLKILSRITEPSQGCVTIEGRAGSLLEVGTGFHPELTGRENIYLNGAILGMSRAEIKRKFDEIVDFSGVEKFIDTPVKRYSSGMQVRLAFSVAAHLEPEILIIDEILAVGDAEFQKKCLGKMGEVAYGGRTILFVSHNMGAIKSLCSRAIVLSGGQLLKDEFADDAIRTYLKENDSGSGAVWEDSNGHGDHDARLYRVAVRSAADGLEVLKSSSAIVVELDVQINTRKAGVCVGFDLVSDDGVVVLRAYDNDDAKIASLLRMPGKYRISCRIPAGLLHGKLYNIEPKISIHNEKWIVDDGRLVSFKLILDHGVSPYWATLNASNRPGVVAPIFEWTSERLSGEYGERVALLEKNK